MTTVLSKKMMKMKRQLRRMMMLHQRQHQNHRQIDEIQRRQENPVVIVTVTLN